jgi:predicted nucleic acid-binding protein
VIVADASWIIALRDPSDRHHPDAVAFNESTIGEEVLLHPLTLAECLVAPARQGKLEEAAAALRSACRIVDDDEDAPLRWAQLRATANLRLSDVIVVDTAVVHGARAIASSDDRVRRAARAAGIDSPVGGS